MNTLLEQSAALRENMRKVSVAEKSRDTIDAWQPLRERLPEFCNQLERLFVSLRLLQKRGLLSAAGVVPAGLKNLRELLATLRDNLLNAPPKVMQRNRWANTAVALEGAAKSFEQNLTRAWKAFVQDLAPRLDDWAPFLQFDQFGAELREIKRLQAELEVVKQSLPRTEDEIASIESKAAQIHELVKKLDFGDIPKEVQAFLKRVMNPAGATLADLTPDVSQWLASKRLADSFKVILGIR